MIQPAILSTWCPLGRVAISIAHIALCPPQGATHVWSDLLLRGRPGGKHDVWKTLPHGYSSYTVGYCTTCAEFHFDLVCLFCF